MSFPQAPPISALVLTKNSGQTLTACLQALVGFDEVVVCDNGSADDTLEIAASFANVTLLQTPFIGFGPLRRLATGHARNPWIFAVDSDEVVTGALAAEINALVLDETKVYAVNRHNHYGGKRIRCCGWSPDYVVRLFHRQVTGYNDNPVHESVQVPTHVQVVRLIHPVHHFPFRNVADLINKMQHYSTLYAQQHGGHRYVSVPLVVVKTLAAFVKDYFLKGGFLEGAEGLLIAVSNANGVFYKYMKLREINRPPPSRIFKE